MALGRLEECQEVIAKALTEPGHSPCDHGGMMVQIAAELRAHGHDMQAREMAQRALDWLEATELPLGCSQRAQEDSIKTLSLLGRHEQAYELATGLLEDQPDSRSLMAEVGVAAARMGDRAVAEEISRKLSAVDEPFTMGRPSYHRATIAAQLGQSAEAVRLLQQAIARGFHDYYQLHVDINLDPLRENPDFLEIVRPKG